MRMSLLRRERSGADFFADAAERAIPAEGRPHLAELAPERDEGDMEFSIRMYFRVRWLGVPAPLAAFASHSHGEGLTGAHPRLWRLSRDRPSFR